MSNHLFFALDISQFSSNVKKLNETFSAKKKLQ